MRSQTSIRHLAYIRLMHQALVDLNLKNIGWKLDGADLVTGHVTNRYFHDSRLL
jgi:hypothetical protein